MQPPSFFTPRHLTLSDIYNILGLDISDDEHASHEVTSAEPIETAGPGAITFLDNNRYARFLQSTKASAVICSPRYLEQVPSTTVAIAHEKPYEAYAKVLSAMYPTAMKPQPVTGEPGVSPGAHVSRDVQFEDDVTVEAGAVVGKGASIGKGTMILSGAVIGAGVQIGRNCTIGPNATVTNALFGDRVIIHSGVQIGQDGFGFAMGPQGHKKVAQFGRVIIQDDVEIGANSTVDRGANRDTIIGEGTKIDNLVQIAHNVEIGRHCVLVALSGIAGSTKLGDFVVVAAQTGIVGHLEIGAGAQIGGGSGVTQNVAPGEKVMGYPAIPAGQWMRQAAKQMLDAKKEAKKRK